MSKLRQVCRTRLDGPTVRSIGLRLPAGHRFAEHAHDWSQVVYAAEGVLCVTAANRQWVVPPLRCVWLPAGVAHRVQTIGEVVMRTVYVRPDRAGIVAASLRVLDVTALMRELLLEIVRIGVLDDEREEHRALGTLMLTEVGRATQLGLTLTLPVDPRARAVADRVCRALSQTGTRARSDNASLDELTRGTGTSVRTAERLFVKETGMSFGRWRQQARLQFAVRRLGEGVPVTSVAYECGYESVSAFVTMFKRALGATPGQYCGAGV